MMQESKETTSKNTTRYILMEFVHINPVTKEVDASGIISKECFDKWLRIKKTVPKYPEAAFRDSIKGILTGNTRVKPFLPEIEASLLKVIRSIKQWPCFAHTKNKIGTGKRGWKILGYHEKKALQKADKNEAKLPLHKISNFQNVNLNIPEPTIHLRPPRIPTINGSKNNVNHIENDEKTLLGYVSSSFGTHCTKNILNMLASPLELSESTKSIGAPIIPNINDIKNDIRTDIKSLLTYVNFLEPNNDTNVFTSTSLESAETKKDLKLSRIPNLELPENDKTLLLGHSSSFECYRKNILDAFTSPSNCASKA
jgi:hypothetical protein